MLRRKQGKQAHTEGESRALRSLSSTRLRLVAATTELIEADLDDSGRLGTLLEARVPPNWPPDLYDSEALRFTLRQLRERPGKGWSFWYLLAATGAGDELVGICGFKGWPDPNGMAEIGYSILQQHRNRGYATEAVSRLLQWAFSHAQVRQVSAETLPHLVPSLRVMAKSGFVTAGAGSERGVVRYVVSRPDHR